MSYNVLVTSFSRKKNNEMWNKFLNNKSDDELDEKIEYIENEINKIQENPRYVIDGMLYEKEKNETKKLDILLDLKETKKYILKNKNDIENLYICGIDNKITEYFNELEYFGQHYPFHDFFSELFRIILDINIATDYEGTLSLVSTNDWVKLYKNISVEFVVEAINSIGQDSENFEIKDYYFSFVRTIRDILRNCDLDANGVLKIYDEQYLNESNFDTECGFESNVEKKLCKERVKEIKEQFIQNI